MFAGLMHMAYFDKITTFSTIEMTFFSIQTQFEVLKNILDLPSEDYMDFFFLGISFFSKAWFLLIAPAMFYATIFVNCERIDAIFASSKKIMIENDDVGASGPVGVMASWTKFNKLIASCSKVCSCQKKKIAKTNLPGLILMPTLSRAPGFPNDENENVSPESPMKPKASKFAAYNQGNPKLDYLDPEQIKLELSTPAPKDYWKIKFSEEEKNENLSPE